MTTYIRWCLDSLRHRGLFKPQSACCIAEFPLPVPPPRGVCVSVCVCERVSESLRFYYLSASPGEVWSSCSVFFTSLAIFSSHCGSLHIPGSGSQLWICGQSETSEYISQKKKTDKTPSISITSSPQKVVAIVGISMWFWGDESGVRRRREDAGSYC